MMYKNAIIITNFVLLDTSGKIGTKIGRSVTL